jgi:DNA-binding GntR family transcriptional regulator
MTARALLAQDSTVRVVYDALSAGERVTQAQLRNRTGLALAPVCRALQRLIEAGYAKRVGDTLNRFGTSVGKPQRQYMRTDKVIEIRDVAPATPTALELAAVMNEIIRRGKAK